MCTRLVLTVCFTACLTSSCQSTVLTGERKKEESVSGQIYCSVSRQVILSAEHEDPVPSQALALSSSLRFTMVQCFRLTELTPSSHHSYQSKQIPLHFNAGSVIALLFLSIKPDVKTTCGKIKCITPRQFVFVNGIQIGFKLQKCFVYKHILYVCDSYTLFF